jgi:hypothetical protein
MTTLFPAFRKCVDVSAQHSSKVDLHDHSVTISTEVGIIQDGLLCRGTQNLKIVIWKCFFLNHAL